MGSFTGEDQHANQVISKSFAGLEAGSYTFEIREKFGDGLKPNGSLRIHDGQVIMFENDGKFFDFLALNIRVGEPQTR